MARAERPDEILARRVVADVLGVPVVLHDDGTLPSMPDALILRDGGSEPLEVVQDEEESGRNLQAQLDRLGREIALPKGAQSWMLYIARGSHPMRLPARLPALLASLDPTEATKRLPLAFRELGVVAAAPIQADHPHVVLLAQGWSWSGTGPDLNGYVTSVLAAQADVPSKLLRHSPTGRKHAFIWVGISSLYPGWSSIRDSDRALPVDAPALPAGVTDVWLGTFAQGRNILYFSPDQGWVRPGRVITEDDARLF